MRTTQAADADPLRSLAARTLAGAALTRRAGDAVQALNAALDATELRVGVTATVTYEADDVGHDAIELCGWGYVDGLLVASGHGDRAGEPLYRWTLTVEDAIRVGAALLEELEPWSLEVPDLIARVVERRAA